MSEKYKIVASKLKPTISFANFTNYFGKYSSYVNQMYDQDLTLLHQKNESLFSKYFSRTINADYNYFNGKDIIYDKRNEDHDELNVIRDPQTGHVLKYQKIQYIYHEDIGTEDEEEEDKETMFLHIREILFQKLLYDIMLVNKDNNDYLQIPQIFKTFLLHLEVQASRDYIIYSVIEMEDVGMDFSDFLLDIDTNEQRTKQLATVGIKLLKTLTHINKSVEFIHCDTKLNNIMTKDNKFYLIDFGMSHITYKDLHFTNELSMSKSINFISDVVFYIYHALGLSYCADSHIFTEKMIQFCSNIILQVGKRMSSESCSKLTMEIYKLIYVKNRKTFKNTNFPREFNNFLVQ